MFQIPKWTQENFFSFSFFVFWMGIAIVVIQALLTIACELRRGVLPFHFSALWVARSTPQWMQPRNSTWGDLAAPGYNLYAKILCFKSGLSHRLMLLWSLCDMRIFCMWELCESLGERGETERLLLWSFLVNLMTSFTQLHSRLPHEWRA
jgi:hypothetical protein